MTAPIDRPNWDEAAALVPVEEGSPVQPAELPSVFANPAVEQRYRTMVASRMAKASLPAHEARDALDPALIADWEASGGFTARLAQAQKGAISILEQLDPEGRATFIAEFDALPEGVRSALFSEIALGSAGSVRNAADADVARFASTPEGSALTKEWGHRARRNLAVIRDRVSRILARMGAEEMEAATTWFDALPPAAAAAIYRILVAK